MEMLLFGLDGGSSLMTEQKAAIRGFLHSRLALVKVHSHAEGRRHPVRW